MVFQTGSQLMLLMGLICRLNGCAMCSQIRGRNPCALKTEAALLRHPLQTTPMLRMRTRRKPMTLSRGAWSWVAGWPWISLYRRLPVGMSASPISTVGCSFSCSLKLPSWKPGHGGAVPGCWPTSGPQGAPWGEAGWREGASAWQRSVLTDARPTV